MTFGQTFAKLEIREEKLRKIISSNTPLNPSLVDAHELRVSRARDYFDEIGEIRSILEGTEREIFIVPYSVFEDKVEKADFASIEADGLFYKIAFVDNFPVTHIVLLYLLPISEL